MLTTTKRKIEFFNLHSTHWEEGYDAEELDRIRHLIRRCGFIKTENVLEAGSGAGTITSLLADRIDQGTVISIDNSPAMIERSKEKGFPPWVHLILSDADNLPFKNAVFTSVLSFNSFPHFENKQKTLMEFYRVLRPGGHLFIVHSISGERLNWMHRKIGGPVEKDVLPSREEFISMLFAASFEKVEIDEGANFYFLKCKKPAFYDETIRNIYL